MKILLIHQAFVGPDEAGGTRHFEFAKHMREAGHELTVVASNLSYLTGRPAVTRRAVFVEQRIEGVRVLRAYTVGVLHRGFVWRVVAFVSFMLSSVWAGLRAGKVDLVMGTSPPIFQAVSAWLLAILRRRPLLLEVRDLWPEFAIDMGVLKNPALIAMSRWLEAFLYHRADRLAVNSPAYREYLLDKGIAGNRISVIPNGVDTTAFGGSWDTEAVRRDLGLDASFVVTYAGALGLANDIPTLLRAAARLRHLPDVRLLLVGDGKEKPVLEQTARAMNLGNVVFAGVQPKSRIPAILAASDVCAATLQNIRMFRTTYPNKVFDYMAAGRPTVLGIDGVIREVIESCGAGIFVTPGDDAGLAAAVERLYRSPTERAEMGAAARRCAVERFDRRIHAQLFESLATEMSPCASRSRESMAGGA